jgi:hypothetical protein
MVLPVVSVVTIIQMKITGYPNCSCSSEKITATDYISLYRRVRFLREIQKSICMIDMCSELMEDLNVEDNR